MVALRPRSRAQLLVFRQLRELRVDGCRRVDALLEVVHEELLVRRVHVRLREAEAGEHGRDAAVDEVPDKIENAVESNTKPPFAKLDGPYAADEGSNVAMSAAASFVKGVSCRSSSTRRSRTRAL